MGPSGPELARNLTSIEEPTCWRSDSTNPGRIKCSVRMRDKSVKAHIYTLHTSSQFLARRGDSYSPSISHVAYMLDLMAANFQQILKAQSIRRSIRIRYAVSSINRSALSEDDPARRRSFARLSLGS